MAKRYKVTFQSGRITVVRAEGLRAVLRDLGEGEYLRIERMPDASIR